MNIIGNGRVGGFLSTLTESKIYGRQDELVDFNDGPIIIATRNDSLKEILSKIPEERIDDLVFLQNGMYLNTCLC